MLILLLASTNVFFYYLHNTFGEYEKDWVTFQAVSGALHNRLRVWTIIQQVIKKQSLNAYHSLGLCDNLYIIIELIKQIKLDVEGGFRWKYGGRASLPVCGILRRGIDVYSSFSPRSGEAEFVQLFPVPVPHAAEQSIPFFFLHEHP